MKLYTFNCNDFILSENGGLFIRGSREFSFTCSSELVRLDISRLVAEKACFESSELPNNVVTVLLQNGLLREYDHRYSYFSSLKQRLHDFFAVSMKSLQKQIPVDAFIVILFAQNFIHTLRAKTSILLFPVKYVTAMVSGWAFLTNIKIFFAAALFDFLWLLTQGGNHIIVPSSFTNISTLDTLISFGFMLVFVMFHELAHAAAAYYRIGSCGEIRMGRMLIFFPYLFVTIPKLDTIGKLDKFTISASGIVFQIFVSIVCLYSFGEYLPMKIAAEMSIMMGITNLLPILKLDGYWMMCDVSGRRLRLTLNFKNGVLSNILYTIVVIFIACSFVLTTLLLKHKMLAS